MKNKEVIIIGGDHYNTLGVVRSLGEEGVYPHVFIQGNTANSFVLKSKYINTGAICKSDEELQQYLHDCANDEKPVIICCSDRALTFVLTHYEQLHNSFILPVCKDYKQTSFFLEKNNITEYAQKYGLTIPLSWTAKQRQMPANLIYPVITKSLTSVGGRKTDMVVCRNEEELKQVLEDPNHCDDYQIQQYIEYEKEISILGCVLPNGHVFFSGCIDKLRTCMIGTSSYAVMVDNSIMGEEKNRLETMLTSTGYSGLFSAEYLLKDGKFYFLEVNFRNDGNTYVATAAGINLPYIWYKGCCDVEVSQPKGKFPCYFMLDIEDFIARKENGVPFRQWNRNRKQTNVFLVYNKNDQQPFRTKAPVYIKSSLSEVVKVVLKKIGLFGFLRKVKNHSLKQIWSYFKVRILKIDYHKVHYLRLNIDIDKLNKQLEDFDLNVKELCYDDFLKGDPEVFKGAKMELYKKRCKDSTYKAYGIMDGDRLVYSYWVSLHRLGMTIEPHPYYLSPNEGYLEDAYCDPVARGRGYHSKMTNYLIKKIYEAGKSRAIVIVRDGNAPALKANSKSGFEDIGTFYHGYFFGKKFNTLNKKKYDDK